MSLIIDSIEYFLPNKIVTNEDLQEDFPDWDLKKISEKTGVLQRHIADKNETAFDLSVKACEKLFYNFEKNSIDGIIYCTQSPDFIMPSNSFLLHKHFNFKKEIFAYDFNHACTGFIYCLAMANAFLKADMGSAILLINADTYSKYIYSKDRSTRALFGDGAAATIVRKDNDSRSRIIDMELGSLGSGYKNFWIQAGGLRLPVSENTKKEFEDLNGNIRNKNNIEMDGFGVWSFINSVAPKQIQTLLNKNTITKDEIDQFIFHQASKMTLDSIKRKMNLDDNQVYSNIENIGNTVSASIPITLKDAINDGKIKRGSKLILSGFGVGLSYGSILMEY